MFGSWTLTCAELDAVDPAATAHSAAPAASSRVSFMLAPAFP
jgi:hypothetical protein